MNKYSPESTGIDVALDVFSKHQRSLAANRIVIEAHSALADSTRSNTTDEPCNWGEGVPEPLQFARGKFVRSAPDSLEGPIGRRRRLAAAAQHIRRSILTTIGTAKLGHVGGDLSVADILATLFFGVLRYDASDPRWSGRDRFILSKGHCSVALYSTLALAGFISETLLPSFAGPLSPLNGHPNRRKVPGVESNTGPLGHGLPVGVGCAIASQLAGANWRTFVVLGDGELQEGSNWEAAMAASHRQLSNLTAIVDRNRLQQGAKTEDTNALEPLADKWASFGWETVVIDGHDYDALFTALSAHGASKPRCIIANTHKGRGVSFMEDGVEWHHKVPSPDQIDAALAEITR